MDDPAAIESRLPELVGRLSLEEKVRLLTGADHWRTQAMPKLGLRSMVMSDGPSGVRGETWDERSPSLSLPSTTALASSWDSDIAYRFGRCVAAEARDKNVDIVLGPTVNLHRSPLAGRHFESFSEDPLLTAEMATGFVRGVQSRGVAATPKHYVANDSETDRFSVNVVVSDRSLHELYLQPFETSVIDGRAWMVMSAYNAVNGVTCTEHPLLETPLRSAWGFDGVVVGDWAAVRSLESAEAEQDLAMPGPHGPWGEDLVAAVLDGRVAESVIDRKALRLLRLAARVGALEESLPVPAVADAGEDRGSFALTAAIEGTVLLKNASELPWRGQGPRSIAVIGQHATQPRTQGGGSATVASLSVVSPLEGVIATFPDALVRSELGVVVQDGIVPFALEDMLNPVTGGPGAHVRFLDERGAEIHREDRFASALVYFAGGSALSRMATLSFVTRFTPRVSGELVVGFSAVARGRLFVGDLLLGEGTGKAVGQDVGAAFLAPPTVGFSIRAEAGVPLDLRFDLEPNLGATYDRGALSVTFGIELQDSDPDLHLERAVRAAAEAEVALVVVGTSPRGESEGYDRQTLALPGRQDDLVRAVAAVNPRTVVVVNSGAPVLLPWRDEVSAILLTYFAGQACGTALADILSGAVEPGGRLPTTWPAEELDVPVISTRPVDGDLRYDEGIHVGYRAWLRAGTPPAYPFGFGLGYTSWELRSAELLPCGTPPPDVATVRDTLTNTGERVGKSSCRSMRHATNRRWTDRRCGWWAGPSSERRPGRRSPRTYPCLTVPWPIGRMRGDSSRGATPFTSAATSRSWCGWSVSSSDRLTEEAGRRGQAGSGAVASVWIG